MSPEVGFGVVLVVAHLAAIGALAALLMRGSGGPLGWWPRDDDGGLAERSPHNPTRGGPPLRDALPADLRLREHGRLADAHRRERRSSPEPAPQPQRERAGDR